MLSQNLLASLDLRVLTVQRTDAGRWWRFRQVSSPFSRLWLVLEGRAAVRHHDHSYALTPGKFHLVPAFVAHDCSCAGHLDHYHLHLVARLPTGIDLFSLLDCDYQIDAPPETLASFQRLEALYPQRKLPCFDPFRAEYQELPARMDQASPPMPAADWLEAQGLLRLLLAPFLRSARAHEGMHARATTRFLAVQEFIHEHMREHITLADLARVAEWHPTYFSDRFHQLVGVRPLEYLARRRIERAQYLLLTTRATVKEVAYEVGLSDPAYFTRVFTRLCRVAPSHYRSSFEF